LVPRTLPTYSRVGKAIGIREPAANVAEAFPKPRERPFELVRELGIGQASQVGVTPGVGTQNDTWHRGGTGQLGFSGSASMGRWLVEVEPPVQSLRPNLIILALPF
jgi:hypothetical protein